MDTLFIILNVNNLMKNIKLLLTLIKYLIIIEVSKIFETKCQEVFIYELQTCNA